MTGKPRIKRKKLKDLHGKRVSCEGRIVKFTRIDFTYGYMPWNQSRKRVLLEEVIIDKYQFDHVWIEKTTDFNSIITGSRIKFTAIVEWYRDLRGTNVGYGLILPENVEILD